MAAPLDTNHEGEGDGESQLDNWLKQNRLMKAREKFMQMEVIYEDLIGLSSSSADELKAYARDELGLNLMASSRFAIGVSSLKPKKKKDRVIRIVLDPEEATAIANIDTKQKEINARISKATDDIDTLTQFAKTNENEVNAMRKEVINALNKRFDDLILESNAQIQKKEQIIGKYIEALKAYHKALASSNSQCDQLLEDDTMDKSKRKRAIVAVSQKVLKREIKDINVRPKVEIEMNGNEILKYIDAFGNVNHYICPPAPSIAVHNVESTSATVRFNNIQSSYECAVDLCANYGDNINGDEKENDIVWKQICLVKGKKEHKMSNLKGDRTHAVRARYKNENGFSEWCQPQIFKTKKIPITAIHSSILREGEVSALASLLHQSGKGLSERWNLLYRGSRDGFRASAFHNKCDGKSKTLIIICTDTNNVFGGYASVPWKSGNGSSAADNDAFIFLIRSSKNYPPQLFTTQKQEYKQYAVRHYSNCMCIFGGGHDILVCDDCNTNTSSSVTGNHTYMNLPTQYYLNGETQYFKVTEIEVFVSQ